MTQNFLQRYNNFACRTKLIESRLLHSDVRIDEIADEPGFTDESHLNKFFRKQRGISPTRFRRQGVALE